MKKFSFYKNINNKTVAIQILSSYYVKEKDRWNVKVMWYNWSPKFGLRFCMNLTQRFNITREQRANWKGIET